MPLPLLEFDVIIDSSLQEIDETLSPRQHFISMSNTFESGKWRESSFIDFLIVSARKGIYHNQFNVIDTSVLRDAQIHPEQYTNLIVRVAGYCAQFVSLMPQAQEAIIARTENTI